MMTLSLIAAGIGFAVIGVAVWWLPDDPDENHHWLWRFPENDDER